ncbi:endopeptidase La [Geobacter hydrogenophilus]|uniref:endopeptidase La n=1 Tax=Geobacter hydrogenophilus TaxID=40983 RepID=UPI001BD9210A|nr:endopeptidase La [Geobacter hydrogenophilus]MBT0893175.1 endopeptidase La [Geobacter hydrogenophilus]
MHDNQGSQSLTRGDLERFPLLPLRDIVVFPHMVVPLFVGREKSISALEAAMNDNRLIFLATQKNAKTEEPNEEDIYSIGTVSQVIQLLKLPDGTVKVLVEGKRRGVIASYLPEANHFIVDVQPLPGESETTSEMEALVRSARSTFESYVKLTKGIPQETVNATLNITDPGRLADTLAPHLNLKLSDRQELLTLADSGQRLERLLAFMESEVEILQLESKIRTRVKKQMEKNQKEYYLNEQMRAIQKELGGKDDYKQEIAELEEKISQGKLSKEAKQKALAELKKLKLMSPASAEAAVVRNYVDWLATLPWGKLSREKHNIVAAERILDADHYGLVKVKERILEFLSVQTLVKKIRGPILCLVGPPGVGKTSLARSIATATGRKFVKMSLGGMRDEAEIRGHRRTYVGAMPGKIIQNLKKAGSNNPVFLLDELDKMSSDFRGDPASAMLEVLDPEQNAHFSDHFLDVEYDLSRVMFIATANSIHGIPRPLLDRLEVIRIDGYTEHEKLAIAERYLVKKQMEANGLAQDRVSISSKAILDMIRFYSRESGVRNLEREIASVCRKVAHRIVKGEKKKITLQPKHLKDFLGPPRFRIGTAEEKDSAGAVTGLAWTEVGGDLLTIEVAIVPGKGKLTITGKLGEVMQESAQAAMTYVRSRAHILGLERDFYQAIDIHIHVPEGAIPKDGPSAGITIATAITSALTGRGVRRDIAMTGEVTLRGNVLPIGGLKEKLLAARRGGIREVIIPGDNQKDLHEIPQEVYEGMTITTVSHMDEVLSRALLEGRLSVVAPSGVTVSEGQATNIVTAH